MHRTQYVTLLRRGAAQVCHVLRVVELREQLEVEEEDGDRQEDGQEEEKEVESGEVESRRVRHDYDHEDGGVKCAQNLSHEMCGVIINKDCEQCAQPQCILWYATRPSKSTSSLVFTLLCMLSCLLVYASFQFSL